MSFVYSSYSAPELKQKDFNPATPKIVFVDMNACFASVEQQYNPHLRNKPTVVTTYATEKSHIVATSYEAKAIGIKTGMTLAEAREIARLLGLNLFSVVADPPKYREVHRKLEGILENLSPNVKAYSIDEFAIDIRDTPAEEESPRALVTKLKRQIATNLGKYITVSIGMAPNIFLAKTASNLEKPDGFQIIDSNNFKTQLQNLELEDLCGISKAKAKKLRINNIMTPLEMAEATPQELMKVFRGIEGYYWHLSLNGWEPPGGLRMWGKDPTKEGSRKSFGNSFVLPYKRHGYTTKELRAVLYRLAEKTIARMKQEGYATKRVYLELHFLDGQKWHKARGLPSHTQTLPEIASKLMDILEMAPTKKVHLIAERVEGLAKTNLRQPSLFEETEQKTRQKVDKLLFEINQKFGDSKIALGTAYLGKISPPDRIAFNKK